MAEVRYSNRFINDLVAIYSDKVLSELERTLASLEKFPELGSTQIRKSLIAAFGKNLRKMPVSSFLIIYRYDGRTIDFLALVYGPSVV